MWLTLVISSAAVKLIYFIYNFIYIGSNNKLTIACALNKQVIVALMLSLICNYSKYLINEITIRHTSNCGASC